MEANLTEIIKKYKDDKESVYNTWFINNGDRLKAFRTIRRGIGLVIEDIKQNKFGNDFRGSSLEDVVNCITEQKQVFEGAAHPFYWKPKLRIPDIYENEKNKTAFGQFLEDVLYANSEDRIIEEMVKLDSRKIKGLGPAVANIIYFIHPTIAPPFNTAIVRGYNRMFKDKKKLGSWEEYLKMREVIKKHAGELSPDLGAFAGLLYEIGVSRILAGKADYITEKERKKIEAESTGRRNNILEDREEEHIHSEMQYHLLKIGQALGYDVICAKNDSTKSYKDTKFSFLCLGEFPPIDADKQTLNTIQLIDVIWFKKGTNSIAGAFEVEKSTSIYSGILRLSDLVHSIAGEEKTFYIVIPDDREKDVRFQLARPSIKSINSKIKYILFTELRTNCDAICKFGDTHSVMDKIAKTI